MKKYYIKTFGCQANKSDSERIAGDYYARGYKETNNWKKADEIVVNTCAVRERAEHRAMAFLHSIGEYFEKQKLPKPKLILTGCMTHHGDTKLYKKLPMIDEILPINEVGFNQTALRKDTQHAWVPISTGCNSFCTYCIVPYSRGKEQSRPMQDIVEEVENLAVQGYEEITLLGQNVNSYGLEKMGIGMRKMLMNEDVLELGDLPSNASQYHTPDGVSPFVQLLQRISKFDEIKTIRFLSANPWDFRDDLIEEIGNNKKIDRYIHLPIQSGSNSVLQRMNRGYTREDYIRLVSKLQMADPAITLGTDIIVGFPNETEEEFKQTVQMTQLVDWKVAFIAMYSPRPGTAAYNLFEDNIPHTVKKKRWNILENIINKKNLNVRPKIV